MSTLYTSTCAGDPSIFPRLGWLILWLQFTPLFPAAAAPPQLSITLSGINARLDWDAVPGVFYLVQSRDSLATGGWNDTATVLAEDNSAGWTDPAALLNARFYRLVLTNGEPTLFEFPPVALPTAPGQADFKSVGGLKSETEVTDFPEGGAGGGVRESVHAFSGEFALATVDLRIPGRGTDFIWARKYRSRVGPDTLQGNGWDFSYNIWVRRVGSHVEVHDGNTRRDVFLLQTNGTFALDGFFREGSISNNAFTLMFADKGSWEFHPFDAGTFAGKVRRSIDRNGNTMNFEYDGLGRLALIVDTLGRTNTVSYDGSGFISAVTDFSGRQVRYEYYSNADADGSFGDLKLAISPAVTGTPNVNDFPGGKTNRYTYSKGSALNALNHNLLTVTDAKGQTWLSNRYNATLAATNVDFDRLETESLGLAFDKIKFVYLPQSPNINNGGATQKAIVNDRVGNVREYFYDALNRLVLTRADTGRADPTQPTTESANLPINPLRANDPAFFETRWEYNADSLVTRVTQPNGNVIEQEYETKFDPNAPRRSRGDLRARRQLPGPLGGDQTMLLEQFEYDTGFGGCGCGFNFVTKYTDARTNVTLHSYDARGNRTNTVHRIPSITEQWEYNSFGQLTAQVAPDNGSAHRRRDEFNYYSSGTANGYLQHRVMDAGGFALTNTYEYDARGNVIRAIDPRGHDTLFTFNALNQVVRQTSRETTNGSGVRYERDTFYDANNNVVRVDAQNRDELGVLQANTHFSSGFDYDSLNRLVRTTQELDATTNVVTEYEYDANGNRTLTRSGEAVAGTDTNNVVRTLYDERDLVFQEIRAPGGADQSTSDYDYDGNGNVRRVRQGLESEPRTTIYAYDGFGRRVSATDAMGNATTNHYDPNSNLLSERADGELTDVLGSAGNVRLAETVYTYDAMDRLIRTDAALFDPVTQLPLLDGQATTQVFYTDNSQPRRVMDDNGHETLTTYDTANRVSVVTDAKTNTTTYAYDANNNLVSTTALERSDLNGSNQTFVTAYTYDNLDRRIRSVDNAGNTHESRYDSRNNRVAELDARTNTVRYVYDGLNRLIRKSRAMTDTGDGGGTVTNTITASQTWDNSSRRVAQFDGNTNRTTYVYDSLNRLVRTVFADGTTNASAYDVHHNRVTTTDANGNVVAMNYDPLNRVRNKTITVGPGVAPSTTFENYDYDGLSRVVRAQNNDSLVLRSYDSLARRTREVLNGKTNRCAYDGVGTKTQCVYPGGRTINYTYDGLDQPATISDGLGTLATYSYLGPGRIEQRDYGNGTRLGIGYDGLRRPLATLHTRIAGGQAIDSRTYAWDRMNNKTVFNDPLALDNRAYQYDSFNRLIRSDIISGSSVVQYELDSAGNRTSVTGGSGAGTYTRDTNAPPADFQMNQYTTTAFDSRQYDANGNLTGTFSAPRFFTYDYRNRIVQFVNTGLGLNGICRYDCFGRRTEKIINGVSQRFFYEGMREIEEQNQAGTTVATYVWGAPQEGPLQMTRGGQRAFFHTDDRGSALKVTDANANVVEQYRYDDFGAPSFFNGSGTPMALTAIGNPYLFAAGRFDPEIGFYQSHSRYLDPAAGRFITRSGPGAGLNGSENFYTYAGNNPGNSFEITTTNSPISCCCPKKVEIDPASVEETGPYKKAGTKNGKPYNYTMYGHTFSVTVEMEWIQTDNQIPLNERGCNLLWMEYCTGETATGANGQPPQNEWYNAADYQPNSGTLGIWKGGAKSQPSQGKTKLNDRPEGSVETGDRTLSINVTVTSHEMCPCENQSLSAEATQTLQNLGKDNMVQDFKIGPPPKGVPPVSYAGTSTR